MMRFEISKIDLARNTILAGKERMGLKFSSLDAILSISILFFVQAAIDKASYFGLLINTSRHIDHLDRLRSEPVIAGSLKNDVNLKIK